MTTRVRSHAKINLGLAIGPARPDGYHGLATIYQTLAIHDVVEVTAIRLTDESTSQIVITCNDPRVPCDDRNTCWKMVERVLNRLGVSARVQVHIEKTLPVRGGLGAGSANAAAALIGLEKELGMALSGGDRLAIAAETGSDVPLFLVGGTVLGLGRGEEVYPLPDLSQSFCVLAVPDVGISTPQAFQDWDRLQDARNQAAKSASEIQQDQLTIDPASDRLKQLGRMWAAALAAPQELHANATGVFPAKDRAGNLLLELVRTGIENDFETVVFTQYPSLRDILETLKNGSQAATPAIYAALSGSGSVLFGLYETAAKSCAVAKRLIAQGIPAYETTTVSRDLYWRDIFDARRETRSVQGSWAID